jgi:4-hydroxybutyrate CoA-transferase
MDWRQNYKNKIVSADVAVQQIKSGNRVIIGHACGEPTVLVDAMVRRASELRDVELVHQVSMGKAEYCKPEMSASFRYNGCFLGASTRTAVAEGRSDYIPCFFGEMPKMLLTRNPVDVLLVMVSPPDKNGKCSYGVSCDYTEVGVRNPNTIVIAQINSRMPYTFGTLFDIERADFIVDAEQELIELTPPKIGEIEEKIAKNIAELIEDGSTLQLGIGAIPDAVIRFLGDKKNLGIHSEMFSDGVLGLAKKGVVNNSKKTINNGKFCVAFLMGTRALYDFVDKNPDIMMCPVDYVNDPFIISQHDKMVAINSTMQVALDGACDSEAVGTEQYSGIGGQVDFVRGANRSKGGKPIIALPSTAKGGTVSKIVSRLDPGAPVTTSRSDVRFIVTEYGHADLFGLNLRQRAKALIEIAHPDFRADLERQAWENKNLR